MSSPDPASAVRDCRRLTLPVFADARGSLSFAEGCGEIPFAIARVFYMHGVPSGARRGEHAHRETSIALFALAGAVDVLLDDGRAKATLRLDRPHEGVLIGPWVWHELERFAPGTVCLALASRRYAESDYLRDYGEFVRENAARPA